MLMDQPRRGEPAPTGFLQILEQPCCHRIGELGFTLCGQRIVGSDAAIADPEKMPICMVCEALYQASQPIATMTAPNKADCPEGYGECRYCGHPSCRSIKVCPNCHAPLPHAGD